MRRGALITAVCLFALGAVALAAPGDSPSRSGRLTPAGRHLTPAGRLTATGLFPLGLAVSPDSRWAWAVDAGRRFNRVHIIAASTGRELQSLPIPGGDAGIAFAPDGRHVYLSGLRSGNAAQERLPGAGGDVIQVFAVDPRTGRAEVQSPIRLPTGARGQAASDDLPPDKSVQGWPQSLAVTPDGRRLVVALGQADQAAIVNLATRAVTLVPVGAYPYGVAVDPRHPRAYVSNERDGTVSVVDLDRARVLATLDVSGRAAAGYPHPEGLAADPVAHRVYVAVTDRDEIASINTDSLRVARYLSTSRPEATYGTAPVALAVSPDGQTLYSADAGEDAISVFALTGRPASAPRPRLFAVPRSVASIGRYAAAATRARRMLTRAGRRPAARRQYARRIARLQRTLLYGRRTRGCGGTSLAADRRAARAVLAAYARAARDAHRIPSRIWRARFARAVARARRGLRPLRSCPSGIAFGTPAFTRLGRIPTGAYPTGVRVSPNGRSLVWLASQGLGTGPNGGPVPNTNISELLQGRVGVLPRPSDLMVRDTLTPLADRAIVPTDREAPPPGTPIRPGGPIKHVFFVVKENRTYDQELGDDRRGNGDPNLVMFGDNGRPGPSGGVTPNAHALARLFPLLDNVYADSEESTVGHKVTTGAYANDYTQRYVQAERGKAGNPDEFPIGTPPAAFIFDQAVRQHVPLHIYGELGGGNQPFANEGRSTFAQVQAATDPAYATQVSGICDLPESSLLPQNNLRCVSDAAPTVSDGGHTTTGRIGVQSRMGVFQQEFAAQAAAGTVPALNYLILFNDHTDGDTPGVYSPKADVADNDLGLGQLVEIISHSPIWSSSAIFVVEDDSQDGVDHVDAHRIPVQVVSPYARLHTVVHTRYDQYSFVRTIELILGLDPLSIHDALATPLYDAFVSGGTPPQPDASRFLAVQPSQDMAAVTPKSGSANERLSQAMPWSAMDLVPQRVSDMILWRSVFGPRAAVPSAGPGASATESARGQVALAAYDAHRSVRAALEGGRAGDRDG